ncbi:hypothetical protein ACGFIP_03445 [Micromonospora zamorensis]
MAGVLNATTPLWSLLIGVVIGEGTNDILRTAVAKALVRADLTV